MNELLPRECDRAYLYKYLSECYYLPDERLIDVIKSFEGGESGLYSEISETVPGVNDIDPVGDQTPAASAVPAEGCAGTISNGVELLKVDYSRLFVGPFRLLAPPYGSTYLEGDRKLIGDSTMDVSDWYRVEGLDSGLMDAADHVIAELEFMYFLIFKEIEAIKNSDFTGAADYVQKQRIFLDTHLGCWASEFTDNIEEYAQTEFYKKLARFTKSFIEKDLTRLIHNPQYSPGIV